MQLPTALLVANKHQSQLHEQLVTAGRGNVTHPDHRVVSRLPRHGDCEGRQHGLTSAAIMSKGTIAQKERWALDLLTMDKVGAWVITEPGSGSDAFGLMRSSARRDGDDYILNGSKTFITNGPYADTTVCICKLDDGNPMDQRKVLSFVLDRGMAGFVQSKPLRKMGMPSSPTGELFLDHRGRA